MAPAGTVVVPVSLLRRWGGRRSRDEPVLHLGERFELAEVQEDALAGIALLQVDAVALVGLHQPCALRAQQGVAYACRWWGLRGFVWRDAHNPLTCELPVK